MRKYDMMERAQDTDMLDCMLYNFIITGKIQYVNGVLVGKTYDVKNAIKSPFGMAGKWNKGERWAD